MSMDALVGAIVGNCRLESLVGAGGMGRVYRARHLVLDRMVAVKLVDRGAAEGGAAREAVLAEARAAAKLDDPRVVAVYDVGEDQGLAYIVMQWVEGETLEARVRRAGPLAAEDALRVMRETAAALGVAHAAGIVHRDVKPANIMIDAKGAVKLADFGLAGLAGASSGDGATVGSFHFMPPEQGLGAVPRPSADFYSLGATWFYALTARPPFKGLGPDVMIMHREQPPPDVREFRPDVTVRAAALLARLMAKDPAARPADAAEIVKELSAPSMVLETEESGSPFRILPPPTPEIVPGADPAPPLPGALAGEMPAAFGEPAPAVMPPPPPAPAAGPQAVLGSRGTFFTVFGIIAVAAVGWPWRTAVAQDWVAGAAFLGAFPALLTAGDRKAAWRRPAGVVLWLGAVGCLAKFVLGPAGIPVPPLETMIVCALGGGASLGAVYMGLWGNDAEELLWARVLAPVGGALLAVAGLAWTVPPQSGWLDALSAASRGAWGAWWSTGGAWRWGGLAAVTVALAVARRLKTVEQAPAEGRKLNWNR